MSAENKCLLTKVCPLLSALTCFWRKCNLSSMEKVPRERLRFLPTLPQIQLQTQRSLEATCSPLSQFSRSVELFREFDTLHRTLHHVPFTGGVRGHGHAWFTNRACLEARSRSNNILHCLFVKDENRRGHDLTMIYVICGYFKCSWIHFILNENQY